MLDRIRFLGVFSFVLIHFSCSESDGNCFIEGQIDNPKNISTVFLEELDEENLKYKVISLARVVDGEFQFKEKFKEPELKYLRFAGKKDRLTILLEEHLVLKIKADSVLKSNVVLGEENKQLFEYNRKSLIVKDKSANFRKANFDLMKTARLNNNKKVIDSLQKINYKINYGYIENMDYQLKNHPNSFISVLLIEGLFKYPKVEKSKIENHYNSLNDYYKNLLVAKKIKAKLDKMK